jgi:hypothetical protein
MSIKLLISLGTVAVLTFGGLAGHGEIDKQTLIYPSPDKLSAFLVSYAPEKVVDRFRTPQMGSLVAPWGQAAGEHYVTETKGYFFQLPLRNTDRDVLLDALYDDAQLSLQTHGAHILSKGGDTTSGFNVQYAIDHSVGLLIISPLAPATAPKLTATGKPVPLPPDVQFLSAQVEVSERWYPNPGYLTDTAPTLYTEPPATTTKH